MEKNKVITPTAAAATVALTAAATTLTFTPFGGLLMLLTDNIAKSGTVAKEGKIEELRAEAERQDLAMQMAERQSKVAQELALAKRIETAHEVEMEEFYDVSGAGSAGASTDGTTISLGVGGRSQRVSKRIFRFRGISTIPTEPPK